ncbi:hypothetical protein Glove_311g9 [Diversispora epigaea]|uniref:Protein kinase domain-containing protein n=1 Tax=Diversispora epigaea TaxID=1348612 RepID=A0A397HYW3_9GLOM|nr:hypothetical protein Glove_311g9 [Diversispora epigaea]
MFQRRTWSSGNNNVDKIIQESQKHGLQWMLYDDFKEIKHIADGGHGPVYFAKLKNYWEYNFISDKVVLKEIKDSRYDIAKFLKVIIIVINYKFITKYYRISKNPST